MGKLLHVKQIFCCHTEANLMVKMLKKAACIVFFMLLVSKIDAQVVMNGTVVNVNGELLPDVYVIPNGSMQTITQKDGSFEITCPDDSVSFQVTFSCIGYSTKNIKLYKGETNIQILLIESAVDIDEVVVRAPKYSKFSNYAAQTIKMNSMEVYTNPQAMGDIIGGLQIMPGVQRNSNDGRLIIQGGSTDETLTFVDGLLLFNQYNLGQKNVSVRSRFSPDLFRGVALQSSGYGAQYGNAMSGILQLNTISRTDMDEAIDINVSSVSVESAVVYKNKNSSIRGNVAYMNLTPYGSVVKDDYTQHRFFNQFSSDVFVANQFSSGVEIKTHLTYNKTNVDYSFDNIDNQSLRNRLNEDNFLSSMVTDIPISNKVSLYAGVNLAYNNFSCTDVSFASDSVNDTRINSHQKLAFLYRTGIFTNSVGVENVYSQFDEAYRLDSLYRLDYSNNQMALYDEMSFIMHKLNVNIGLRGEYSSLLRKYAFSPRLYVAYKLSAEHIVSLSVGKYFQLPNEKYLKFSGKTGYNDVYASTCSYSYVHELSKLQLDLYYKKYNHLTTFDLNDMYYTHIGNAGKGTSKGMNVFWKSNANNLEYWLSYGYVHANVLNNNFSKYYTPTYLSNHTFNVTLKYWLPSLKTLIGFGGFIDSGAVAYKEDNPDISKKTPYRSSIDLSLSYVPVSSLIIHVSCQNVLGRKNVFGYEYSAIGDAYREVTNPSLRFYYIGIFLTISKTKTNQLKSL